MTESVGARSASLADSGAPLAESAGDVGTDSGGAFGRPLDECVAEAQLVDAFSRLAYRQVQRGHIQRVLDRAGETLTPLAAWLLVRAERDSVVDPATEARTHHIPMDRIRDALSELHARQLVDPPHVGDGQPLGRLTEAGCRVLSRLVAARRAHLADLVAEGNPTDGEDAASYLRRSVRDMIPDVRRPA